METDAGGNQSRGKDQKYCVECGEIIREKAEICPECGVRQPEIPEESPDKDRMTAAFCALFCGGFGVHHFYLGNRSRGTVYFLFSWTFIPIIVGWIEGFIYIAKSDADFQRDYVESRDSG